MKPGQSDLIMFHNVRVAVMDKTNGDQVPWTEDGIQRRQRVLFGDESKLAPPQLPKSLSATRARPSEAAGVGQAEPALRSSQVRAATGRA